MIKDYYWIIWMIRDYTNDILKEMIKDLLLDYMNDKRLYWGYYKSED